MFSCCINSKQSYNDSLIADICLQESYARRCFNLIDEYAPNFSSSVIGYDMLTPPDLEREFGLTGTKFVSQIEIIKIY